MASRKRIYDAEIREGAIRIVTETGKPIPEVAEDLGIHPGTLHSWVSRARRNGSPSSDRPVAAPSGGRVRESERAELERLRAEAREKDKRIRELEMERDVCKRFVTLWGEVAEADPAVAVGVISSCKAEEGIPHRVARRARGVSVNTVAKLMAELGLAGRKVKRRRSLTRPGRRPAAPDFVRRDFTAEEPDLVWAGDMTEIDTGEGKLYLATVIDLFSRRLLGYAMGARHDAELVVASLNMAAATRGGDVRGVIMHTDRGSEYCSRKFKRACRKLGIVQSMGRVGSCFDNAVSEAFNSVLKVEYVHRHTFRTRTEAHIKIATWITDFYNTRRLHSVCGFKSPIDYEREYRTTLAEGLAA